jgi:hypothetical protein
MFRMDPASTLPTWLLVDSLAEPDTGSAPIFFDELDARRFKSSLDNVERGSSWLVCLRLKLAHCYDADRSLFCEILLAPIEKATRGSALFRCDHSSSMAETNDSINSVENRLTMLVCLL